MLKMLEFSTTRVMDDLNNMVRSWAVMALKSSHAPQTMVRHRLPCARTLKVCHCQPLVVGSKNLASTAMLSTKSHGVARDERIVFEVVAYTAWTGYIASERVRTILCFNTSHIHRVLETFRDADTRYMMDVMKN